MGFDEDLDRAAEVALREMIKLIGRFGKLPREDADTLCSVAANLSVTQLVTSVKACM